MDVIEDSSKFDKLQSALLIEIIQTIRRELERGGITGEAAYKLTGHLTFQVCCVVDGCSILEHEGEPIEPVLTFQQGGSALLTASGGTMTSWMHEYAHGTVDIVFGKSEG